MGEYGGGLQNCIPLSKWDNVERMGEALLIYARSRHGPHHEGIHHDGKDEDEPHLVGDGHAPQHHAGLRGLA